MQVTLREVNLHNWNPLTYNVVGSFEDIQDINEYCKARGWVFKKDSSIYGGYYVDQSSGRSYIAV